MNDFLERLVRVALRVLLVTAGVIVAASLAAAAVVLLAGWGLYAGWARLTGRAVLPFVMRFDPRAGFGRFWTRANEADVGSRTPRADANRGPVPARRLEATDVESRPSGR